MKLAEGPFERIKTGEKTLELRVNDEKRRMIKLGDLVTFRKFPRLEEEITTQVIGLLHYKKFDQLINDMPASLMGYKEKDKAWLKESMYTIYSPEEEQEYGVVGIRLKKVS